MNEVKLQNVFVSLFIKLAQEQKTDGAISFDNGIIEIQEGYKKEVFREGNQTMAALPWEDNGIVGSGQIFQAGYRALSIKPRGEDSIQNLVDWRDVNYYKELNESKKASTEKALKLLFDGSNDEEAFNALLGALGNKYALISFFFFLKDSNTYAVMRPDNMRWRLEMIGAQTSCTNGATWAHYQEYCRILKGIQMFLDERISDQITLLDAHSFLWMLWMLKDASIPKGLMEEGIQDGESCVYYGGKEGAQRLYYVMKYERDAKLRKQAIDIHGYRCAACDMTLEETYGELGANYIEVHHVVPLHTLQEEITVNPETDLVCLCPNCHRMIHRKKNSIMTVSELREIIASARNS